MAGSATSWMMENIIQAKTGLAKRVTAKIGLTPLSLKDTQAFLLGKGMTVSPDNLIRI